MAALVFQIYYRRGVRMYKFDFALSVGDRNIGTVYLPGEHAVNVPVIIYCHGWGSNRTLGDPIKEICKRAMSENVAIVTVDFFGCGDTGGNYSQMTYTRWKNNLSDTLSWIISQPFANKDEIGCCAFSSGSTAALRLATEDMRLAFVISIGTCISAHIGMNGGGPSKILADDLDKLLQGDTSKLFGVDFGMGFYLDTVSKAPIHTMDRIKCPVLFLQGMDDNPFRCADAKMGYDLSKNNHPQTAYISVENGNHGLDNMPEVATEIIFNWLIPVIKP